MSELVVVTDLDGTLLDHHSYSFEPARQALAEIRRRRVPLVLCSSKTRREIAALQDRLGISDPFICENGAAICTPGGNGLSVEALAPPRAEVLRVLAMLREQEKFRFHGFNDWSVEEVAAETDLPLEAAALAAQREYSEPLRWEDGEQRLQRFHELLAEHGLVALQGGRFLSVGGPTDKGVALRRLRQCYASGTTVIALGDSPNDESMLAAADIAVIIRSARSDSLAPSGSVRVIRTRQPGPEGWQEAMQPLLAEFQ